jgi:hypothetical protein
MARLGGSGSSWPRISKSSQFHTFNLFSGLTHLNPTNGRMTKTTTTRLAVINIANVVPLSHSPGFVVEGLLAGTSPMDDWSAESKALDEPLRRRGGEILRQREVRADAGP